MVKLILFLLHISCSLVLSATIPLNTNSTTVSKINYVSFNELNTTLNKRYLAESKELRDTFNDMLQSVNFLFATIGVIATVAFGLSLYFGYKTNGMIKLEVSKIFAEQSEEFLKLANKEQNKINSYILEQDKTIDKEFLLLKKMINKELPTIVNSHIFNYINLFEAKNRVLYSLYKELAIEFGENSYNKDAYSTFTTRFYLLNQFSSVNPLLVKECIEKLRVNINIRVSLNDANLITAIKKIHKDDKDIVDFLDDYFFDSSLV